MRHSLLHKLECVILQLPNITNVVKLQYLSKEKFYAFDLLASLPPQSHILEPVLSVIIYKTAPDQGNINDCVNIYLA